MSYKIAVFFDLLNKNFQKTRVLFLESQEED